MPGLDVIDQTVTVLRAAVMALAYDRTRAPRAEQLRTAWPELGRAWIAIWVAELARDLRTVSADIARAEGASDDDTVVESLENAFWRLAAAREKLHAVIGLSLGVPCLEIGEDAKQTIRFRPDERLNRTRLQDLVGSCSAAKTVLDKDATAKSNERLRHLVAHSLAPILKAHSLTWWEQAIVREGRVVGAVSHHLPAEGTHGLADIGAEALLAQAVKQASASLKALIDASDALATLLREVGELQPPPLVWFVEEVSRSFERRDEAIAASRAAARGQARQRT